MQSGSALNSLQALAGFVSRFRGLPSAELPPSVVDAARACLLDSLGCALGATTTEPGQTLLRTARRLGTGGTSTVVGSRVGVGLADAAFTNAELTNVLDFDDTYFGHLGATVVPVALGLAEVGGSGADMLSAIVVGYEVGGRFGAAMADGWREAPVLGFGTWQVFSSAAAAACLLRLDEERILHALALAGSQTPVAASRKTVLGQTGVSMCKNNFGSAARTGLTAALLAAEGFRGAPDLMDGETGFWRMAGARSWAPEHLTAGLGSDFVLPGVEFKPYPVCRWLHPALDALETACPQAMEAGAVEAVTVTCPTILTRWPYDNTRPANMYQAQFSMPFAVAAALIAPRPGLAWHGPAVLNHPVLHRLMDRVKLVAETQWDNRFPHEFPARVTLSIGGRSFDAAVTAAKGSRENPMPADALREKFLGLAESVLPSAACLELLALVQNLEALGDLRPLARLLQGA